MISSNRLLTSLLFFVTLFGVSSVFGQQTARGAGEISVDQMPEASCFPNPLAPGASLTISVEVPATVLETATFSVKIIDESGQQLYSAELPDELEFTPPRDRFSRGVYYVQFFQNGRLFETQELLIK